jgi:hypothetical protein
MLLLGELFRIALAQPTDDGERGERRFRGEPSLDCSDVRIEHGWRSHSPNVFRFGRRCVPRSSPASMDLPSIVGQKRHRVERAMHVPQTLVGGPSDLRMPNRAHKGCRRRVGNGSLRSGCWRNPRVVVPPMQKGEVPVRAGEVVQVALNQLEA